MPGASLWPMWPLVERPSWPWRARPGPTAIIKRRTPHTRTGPHLLPNPALHFLLDISIGTSQDASRSRSCTEVKLRRNVYYAGVHLSRPYLVSFGSPSNEAAERQL